MYFLQAQGQKKFLKGVYLKTLSAALKLISMRTIRNFFNIAVKLQPVIFLQINLKYLPRILSNTEHIYMKVWMRKSAVLFLLYDGSKKQVYSCRTWGWPT